MPALEAPRPARDGALGAPPNTARGVGADASGTSANSAYGSNSNALGVASENTATGANANASGGTSNNTATGSQSDANGT